MPKDFDEFERYVRSNEFGDEEKALSASLRERFDRLAADPANGLDPEEKELAVGMWLSKQRPLLLLRKYHEWLNS